MYDRLIYLSSAPTDPPSFPCDVPIGENVVQFGGFDIENVCPPWSYIQSNGATDDVGVNLSFGVCINRRVAENDQCGDLSVQGRRMLSFVLLSRTLTILFRLPLVHQLHRAREYREHHRIANRAHLSGTRLHVDVYLGRGRD
jgi:hypothetical protein